MSVQERKSMSWSPGKIKDSRTRLRKGNASVGGLWRGKGHNSLKRPEYARPGVPGRRGSMKKKKPRTIRNKDAGVYQGMFGQRNRHHSWESGEKTRRDKGFSRYQKEDEAGRELVERIMEGGGVETSAIFRGKDGRGNGRRGRTLSWDVRPGRGAQRNGSSKAS